MACVKRRRNRWVVDFRDQDGKRRWQSYKTRDEADTALSTRCTTRTMATVAGAVFGDRGSSMVAVDTQKGGTWRS
jgi:hypothetical protein